MHEIQMDVASSDCSQLTVSSYRKYRSIIIRLVVLSFLIHGLVITYVVDSSTTKSQNRNDIRDVNHGRDTLPNDKEYSYVDVFLEPNEVPDETLKDIKALGFQDRLVEEETVVAVEGKEPQSNVITETTPPQNPKTPKNPIQPVAEAIQDDGDSEEPVTSKTETALTKDPSPFSSLLNSPSRTAYEGLLAQSQNLLPKNSSSAMVSDKKKGQRINLSTQSFSYSHISYMSKFKRQFESTWEYPTEAKKSRLTGSVRLRFYIFEDGQLGNITIVSSSGYDILDQAVLQALHAAAPFDRVPERMLSKREHSPTKTKQHAKQHAKKTEEDKDQRRLLEIHGEFRYQLL
ncbi:MAG: TonB family protein [Proteobacteria bacterium]|nr:TonB family protein [Pseudomonadota bacterium]